MASSSRTPLGASLNDHLQDLEMTEKQLLSAVQNIGVIVAELAKDKSQIKQVESVTQTFLKQIRDVEDGLSRQINHLTATTTGQAHEGSSYSSKKDYNMACHRLEHVRKRLAEMD